MTEVIRVTKVRAETLTLIRLVTSLTLSPHHHRRLRHLGHLGCSSSLLPLVLYHVTKPTMNSERNHKMMLRGPHRRFWLLFGVPALLVIGTAILVSTNSVTGLPRVLLILVAVFYSAYAMPKYIDGLK